MNWERLKRGEKGLPEDALLADLYALSRRIKSGESDTTMSSTFAEDGEKVENYFSNQFFMNSFGQISFITPGCKIGQCSFCSYGASKVKLTPRIVAEEMEKFKEAIKAKEKNGEDIYAILLDSVGSILDKNEFSEDCLEMLFKKLHELLSEIKTIESVGFETHYQTLGSYDANGDYVASGAIEKLIEFKQAHPEIETFVIELGFETANSELRDNLLFKHIDNDTYRQAVQLLHNNGIEVEINVMATLPFLTQKEQIAQSTESIIEALTPYEDGGFGVDSVTLFPLNVRNHTFCNYVFEVQEEFSRAHKTETPDFMQKEFPIWSMVATLNSLIEAGHEELLKKVSVAWFGGRQLSNDGSEKYPQDWEETYDEFVTYRKNLSGENSRANIIRRLTKHPKYQEFIRQLSQQPDEKLSYRQRAEYLHKIIEESNVPFEMESPCAKIKE